MIVSSDDVELAVGYWLNDQITIPDDVAQTIASWYHSPSPYDRNMTALSHGLAYDRAALLDEIDKLEAIGQGADELDALRAWVEIQED